MTARIRAIPSSRCARASRRASSSHAALGLAEPAQLAFKIAGKNPARSSVPLAPRGGVPGDDALYEAEAARAEALATTQTQKVDCRGVADSERLARDAARR